MSIARAIYREKLKKLKSTLGATYKSIPETRTAKVIGPTLVEIDGQYYNARVAADPGTMVTVTNIGRPASAIYATTEGGVFSTTITAGSTSGSGGGGPTIDTSLLLFRDGRYSLTGNLFVSPGVTIDGVDLSAHVIDPDAHHSQVHDIAGTDHTIIGSALDVVGAASVNTLGLITPSAAPGAAEALLKSDGSGQLTLPLFVATTSVTTPLIAAATNITMNPTGDVIVNGTDWSVTAAGAAIFASVQTPSIITATDVDLLINPGGTGLVQFPDDQTLSTVTFDSSFPIAGWRINEHPVISGKSVLTIGEINADELKVKIFVADETRVDRGDEYWTKSYGILDAGFTTPGSIGGTVSITLEDSPALTGALFTNNDWVLIRKLDITAGLTLYSVWGQVATYVDNGNDTQSWTFTLRSGPTSEEIKAGNIVIDFGATGASLIHLSVIDSTGAPYIKMRRWAGANPYTPANYTTYVQIGALSGISNAYVTPSGDGLYLRSPADEQQIILLDDAGLQLINTDISLYSGATQHVNINSTGDNVWFGSGSADKTLHWDGTTLNLLANNSAVITLDTAGNSYFAGVMTIGTSGEIRQGTGTLGVDYTGLRIWRDTNVGRIAGYNTDTLQAYFDTDGKLYAGGGYLQVDENGINVEQDASLSPDGGRSITWWADITTQTGNPTQYIAAYVNAASFLNGLYLGVTAQVSNAGIITLDSGTETVQVWEGQGILLNGSALTQLVRPLSDSTYDLGTSSFYYNNAYIRNLYTDTIVGTPSYSHTHAASDITSGTLDLARIPATLTGKDADTLDGSHASAFALLSATQEWTGSNTFAQALLFSYSTASSAIRASNASATAGTATAIQFRRARGSIGGETATQSGDQLGILSFRGYGATGWATQGADIRGYAAQNMTDTAWGANLRFYTVTNSSTSVTEKMRLTDAGELLINTTSLAASEKLRVNGAIYADGTITGTGTIYVGANAVWHAGNDGSGSGLDADTLDTYQATAFGRLAASNVWTTTNEFQDDLTISSGGVLLAGANTDTAHTLGRAIVGFAIASDYATFSHYDANTSTNYAVGQDTNGRTRLNSASGQAMTFNNAGSEIARFAATGELIIGSTSLFGSESLSVWGGVYVSADVDLSGNIGNPTYASQTTGWQITDVGGADFRSIYADEMVVKSFIADLEQALAGGQLIGKSVAILSRDWVAPYPGSPVRLYVKDLPSAANMATFVANDYVRLISYSRAAGALTKTNCWGVVTSYTDQAGGEQYWTYTRSGAVTNNTIAQVGTATTATTSGATSLTITKVTGTASGHMMIGTIITASAVVITPPSGWTLIDTTSTTGVVISAYYKVAGGSEPANYAWNFDSSVNAAGCIGCYSNVDSASVSKISLTTTSSSTSFVGSTIEMISEKSMVLFLGGVASNASSTAPSGMTERVDTGTGSVRVYMAEQLFAVSGFTGTKTGTISSAQNNVVIMLELAPTYTVTDTNGGAISAGTVIAAEALALDYGVSGDGFYEVNAIDGTYGANSPYSQIVTWSTHPATGQAVRMRMGNLNGLSVADYGIRMGTDVSAAATTTFDFRASTGTVTFGPVGSGKPNLHFTGTNLQLRQNTTAVISLDSTGDSYFAGAMSIGTSGGIYQGSGTFGTPTTGLKIWNDSGTGRIGGYNSGTIQWYAATDGRLYAGAGAAILDATGLTILTDSSADHGSQSDLYAVSFERSSGETVGRLTSYYTASTYNIDLYSVSPNTETSTAMFGSDQAGVIYGAGAAGHPRILTAASGSGTSSTIKYYANTSHAFYRSASASADLTLAGTALTLTSVDLDANGFDIYDVNNLAIGLTSASRALHIGGSGGAFIRLSDTGATNDTEVNGLIEWYRGASTSRTAYVGHPDSTTLDFSIVNAVNGAMYFYTNAVEVMRLSANGNLGFGGSSFGSGVKVIFLTDRTTAPTSNPTGGGILYCESGALKYRGSGGTTTTIANA